MLSDLAREVSLTAGPALDIVLLAVMFAKNRQRAFPALFFFISFDLVASSLLRFVDSLENQSVYAYAYLFFDLISFLTQVWILYEVAKSALKPTGVWERQALAPFLKWAGAGIAAALIASLILPVLHLHTLEAWELRGDVFTGLVTSGLVTALLLAANDLGLPWRSHAIAIGGGLMFWSLAAVAVEGFEVYLDPQRKYDAAAGYLRSTDYVLTLCFWCVSLWRNEPERKSPSSLLQNYVLALHERVRYDLHQAGH